MNGLSQGMGPAEDHARLRQVILAESLAALVLLIAILIALAF